MQRPDRLLGIRTLPPSLTLRGHVTHTQKPPPVVQTGACLFMPVDAPGRARVVC